ncbi:ATP-binding cassette domain-containing protein [Mesorhizobium sp. ORM6]
MNLLAVEHVDTGYGPVAVNRDISLAVGQNEIVTILGPNGAGKTTLLRSIAGLVKRGAAQCSSMAATSPRFTPTRRQRSAS